MTSDRSEKTKQDAAANGTMTLEEKRAQLMEQTRPYLPHLKRKRDEDVQNEQPGSSKHQKPDVFAGLTATRQAKPEAGAGTKKSLFRVFSTGNPIDRDEFLRRNKNRTDLNGKPDQQHGSKSHERNAEGTSEPDNSATNQTIQQPSMHMDSNNNPNEARTNQEGIESSLAPVEQTIAPTVQQHPVAENTNEQSTRSSSKSIEPNHESNKLEKGAATDAVSASDSETLHGDDENPDDREREIREMDEMLPQHTAQLRRRLKKHKKNKPRTTMISPQEELSVQRENQASREAAMRRLAQNRQEDLQKRRKSQDGQPGRALMSDLAQDTQDPEETMTTPAGTPLAPPITTVPPSEFTPLPSTKRATPKVEGPTTKHPGRYPTYGKAIIFKEMKYIKAENGTKLTREEHLENKRRSSFVHHEKKREKLCEDAGVAFLAKKYASRLPGYPSDSHYSDRAGTAAPPPLTPGKKPSKASKNDHVSVTGDSNTPQEAEDHNERRFQEIGSILQQSLSQDPQSSSEPLFVPDSDPNDSRSGLQLLVGKERAQTAPVAPMMTGNSAFSNSLMAPNIHQMMWRNDQRTDEEQMRQREEEKRLRHRDNKQELAETRQNSQIETLKSQITRLDNGEQLTRDEMPGVRKILKRNGILRERTTSAEATRRTAAEDNNDDDDNDDASSIPSEEGETTEEYTERCKLEKERRRAEKAQLRDERQRQDQATPGNQHTSSINLEASSSPQEQPAKRVHFRDTPEIAGTGISEYASAIQNPAGDDAHDTDIEEVAGNNTPKPHPVPSTPASGPTRYPRLDDFYPSPPRHQKVIGLEVSSDNDSDEQEGTIEESEAETSDCSSNQAESDETSIDGENRSIFEHKTSGHQTLPENQVYDYYISYKVNTIKNWQSNRIKSEKYGPYQAPKAAHLAAKRMLDLTKEMYRPTGVKHWNFQESTLHFEGLQTHTLTDDNTSVYIAVKKRPVSRAPGEGLSELAFYEVRQSTHVLSGLQPDDVPGLRETGRGAFVDYGLAAAEAEKAWQDAVRSATGQPQDITFSNEPSRLADADTTTDGSLVAARGGDDGQNGVVDEGEEDRERSVDTSEARNEEDDHAGLFRRAGVFEKAFDNAGATTATATATAAAIATNENEQDAMEGVQSQKRRERIQVWIEEKILRGL